jgi:hypothetical protein
LVLNRASGCRVEDLPFDLRSRLCMTYSCKADATPAQRDKIRSDLAEEIAAALKNNLAGMQPGEQSDLKTLLAASEADGSIWTGAGEKLALLPTQGHPANSFTVAARPRAYFRIVPSGWAQAPLKVTQYAALSLDRRPRAGPGGASSGDFGAQANGFVDVWFGGGPDNRNVATATKYHDGSGEIWTFWSAPQWGAGDVLALQPILQLWRNSLRSSIRFLDEFGANKRRFVEVGLVGADGFTTPGQFSSDRRIYRSGVARHRATQSDWSEAAQLHFLADAFNEVLDLVMYDPIEPARIDSFLSS